MFRGAREPLASRAASGNAGGWNRGWRLWFSGLSNGKGFGMADESKTTKGTKGSGEQVTFDADAKLEADAGGVGTAEIGFEPDEGLAEPKRGPTATLKEEAGKLGSQAAERARAFAGEGMGRASGALDEVASMMRSAADDVDAKLGEQYGRYARSAADGIAGFAENLRGKEVDELLDQASDFVRKSPAIAVGTAAAVGFVLARLIKSGFDAAADTGDGAGSSNA